MMSFSEVCSWRWDNPKLILHVTENVINVLSSHRQYGNQSEMGGLLFANMNQPDGIWLVKATQPHPADRCSYSSIEFNKLRWKEEMRQASKEGLQFIGYWHTHPQDIPQLSPQDLVSIRKFVKRNKHIQECYIAVVVGRSLSRKGIRAWLCTPNTITIQQELSAEQS
ncbi:Mov34/MPN/PAD-1 family protein [Vibrio cholerae]|nr:Mov34/MPN/PAD-1 family protein [Vibrio cholerae]EJL6768893.1 Mov34/MPN/PAD-1 family protein [Vibrio cholerae]ELH4196997.1 Mov34/MPN/PAD-1 family protein [Vibrio cholerae]